MDPSFSNWGIASAVLDFATESVDSMVLDLCTPEVITSKQVRQNSLDLDRATTLARFAFEQAQPAKVVFVEVPVGSQSSRACVSYGACIGVLGALRAKGTQIIQVSPAEVKKSLTGKTTATKTEMINAAMALYPGANWPMHNRKVSAAKAEHMADAIGAIHAGVQTPIFQNLLTLLRT